MIRVKPIDILVPPATGKQIEEMQFFTGTIGLNDGLFLRTGARIYQMADIANWWGLDCTIKNYLPVNVMIEVTGPETR